MGGNWGGQLGDGTTIDRQVPVRVVSPDGTGFLSNIKAVAAGENVSVA
ncbi:MAG: RCC1 domain-containing protein [Thermomicrobiales bacterium]